MNLEIKVKETKPGTFTIIPTGSIDTETHTYFSEKAKPLVDKKARNIVVDMAGVSYISSAGLSAIFSLLKKVRENNGELLLCNLQPQIKKVFEIIKALPTTNIFASVKEADDYLAHMMRQELDKERSKNK